MIKLLDDIKLLEKLALKEPYYGAIFYSAAEAFLPNPELMSIWVEVDEHGKAVSALNVSKGDLILICGEKGAGAEMLFFMQKLSENEDTKDIICSEHAFPVLKKLFPAEVEIRSYMKCSRRIKTESPALLMKCENNIKDLFELRSQGKGDWNIADADAWELRMTRDVLKGQTTILTLHDSKPVSSAVIRGRSKIAGAITSVMTLPDYREHGCASFLTASCSNILHDEGRTAWLVPADEKVQKMYEKLGFKAVGNEYTLILKRD